MSLVINHNMMSMNATRNLNSSYGKLATSTRRLSSGLRVGTAADDAAGLAMRELMRADIKTLGQGLRNANDGISMIQTADGALGVIDAKLIRMKELAEQAATGTYTDVQRKMIDQEYQLMADEITRMAQNTDFNSRKLLAGSGQDVELEQSAADPASVGAALIDSDGNTESWGKDYAVVSPALSSVDSDFAAQTTDPKTHVVTFPKPGTAIDDKGFTYSNNAPFVVNYTVDQATTNDGTFNLETGAMTGFADIKGSITKTAIDGTNVIIEKRTGSGDWTDITATVKAGGAAATKTTAGDAARITYTDSNGITHRTTLENVSDILDFTYASGKYEIATAADSTTAMKISNEVTTQKSFDYSSITGAKIKNDVEAYWEKVPFEGTVKMGFTHNSKTGDIQKAKQVESVASSSYGSVKTPVQDFLIEVFNETTNVWENVPLDATTGSTVDLPEDVKKFRITTEYGDYKKVRDTFSNNTGGKFTITKTDYGLDLGMTDTDLGTAGIQAQKSTTQLKVESEDMVVVNVHFGAGSTTNDSYDTHINMATAKSLGVGLEAGDHIKTQKAAKKALDNLTIAIRRKDKIRAELGSTQNRLSATIENVSIQKENLQASESRISDVDVATEMTEFNRTQIMTNAAVSMLAQANSLPKMAQKLLDAR
jgi:flagellin-like hook-associated protein FlgL